MSLQELEKKLKEREARLASQQAELERVRLQNLAGGGGAFGHVRGGQNVELEKEAKVTSMLMKLKEKAEGGGGSRGGMRDGVENSGRHPRATGGSARSGRGGGEKEAPPRSGAGAAGGSRMGSTQNSQHEELEDVRDDANVEEGRRDWCAAGGEGGGAHVPSKWAAGAGALDAARREQLGPLRQAFHQGASFVPQHPLPDGEGGGGRDREDAVGGGSEDNVGAQLAREAAEEVCGRWCLVSPLAHLLRFVRMRIICRSYLAFSSCDLQSNISYSSLPSLTPLPPSPSPSSPPHSPDPPSLKMLRAA